jgi:hypothetical protein
MCLSFLSIKYTIHHPCIWPWCRNMKCYTNANRNYFGLSTLQPAPTHSRESNVYLCLIKQLAMKTHWEAPPFFTSKLEACGWPTSRLVERDPDRPTHWIGGWVVPRAGLDAVEKNLLSLTGIEPSPSSTPLYRRLSYPGPLTHSLPTL